MDKNDIELLRAALKGTPVSVYDTYGNLCSFNIEDVVEIKQAENEKRIVYIALKNDAITVNEDGESERLNPVIVPGTKKKWCSKLNFKPIILNDEE